MKTLHNAFTFVAMPAVVWLVAPLGLMGQGVQVPPSVAQTQPAAAQTQPSTLQPQPAATAVQPSAMQPIAAGAPSLAGQSQTLEPWTPEAGIVDTAREVLDEIMAIPIRSIPQSLLAEARAIAIVPDLVKGGFIVGVRHGRGLLVVRDENGNWRGPVFISITGASVGWQAGLQATDVILVFVTRQSVQGLLRGKFTIGADAAATAGPIGREAAMATDTTFKSEIYSYSRSRGLFGGVSLDGSALQIDAASTNRYYGVTSMATATQAGQQPKLPPSSVRLLSEIARYSPPLRPEPSAKGAAPGGTGATQSQAVRGQLAESSQRLNKILDDNWRKYLALPPELYAADRQPTAESLNQALLRFNTVAGNASYRTLTRRSEFQDTHRLLQRVVASQTASAGLQMPPPPR